MSSESCQLIILAVIILPQEGRLYALGKEVEEGRILVVLRVSGLRARIVPPDNPALH